MGPCVDMSSADSAHLWNVTRLLLPFPVGRGEKQDLAVK